ncbi:MAG: hypothetical protein IJW77_12330 [Clostridia bacterium]|nr:hypothetical protein [Clostridia bacterium]
MNRTVPLIRPSGTLRYGVLVFFVILMMLFCSIGAAARNVETPFGAVELYAQVNPKNNEEIYVYAIPDEAFLREKQGETLYLFTLQPQEEPVDLRAKSPTATKVVDKTTRFSVSSDRSGERLRAKYVLALGEGADYRVIGEAYVNNPEVLAENTAARAEASTMKGLVVSGALTADAQALGIGHAVIPISADRYITSVGGDPQYACATAGQTTYFDPTAIAQLDALVASLERSNTRIIFRFLLDGTDRGTTEPAAALYAEAAVDGAAGYGFTMDTKLAYQTVNNLFTYFAERYAADAASPIDFIVGYQVNEWVGWYNLGYSAEQIEAQVGAYAAVFRLADLALRAQSANSRVYLPLSNLWATGRPFLSAFAAEMGTDAAWSVAVSPYASNALDDSIWDDTGAKDDPYSTYLTMNNIGILGRFLDETPYLYQKKPRAVIIDDFAVHGTSGDDASQERQAASFVYAYYQAASAGFIDAFIWHRVMDGAGEQCSLGLRQLDAQPKPVYELFRVIDTQQGAKAAEQYAKIVGGRKWSSIIDGYSKKDTEEVKLYSTSGTPAPQETLKQETTLFLDFSDRTLQGFMPEDYMASAEVLSIAEGTEINTSILSAVSHPMDAGQAAAAAAETAVYPLPQNTKNLYLTVRADASAQPAEPNEDGTVALPQTPTAVLLRLQLQRGGETVIRYLGEAELTCGTWSVLAFDISDYAQAAGGADLLRLSLIGTSGEDITYTLSLNDIRYDTGVGLIVLRVFIGILIVLGVLVLLFAVLVIRAQIIRRRRRRRRAAQRAAYLARQRQLQAQMQKQGIASPQTGQNVPPQRRGPQRRPEMYSRSDDRTNGRSGQNRN